MKNQAYCLQLFKISKSVPLISFIIGMFFLLIDLLLTLRNLKMKMKTLQKVLLLLMIAIPMAFSGCQKSDLDDNVTAKSDDFVKSTSFTYTPCGTQLIGDLYPQGIPANNNAVYDPNPTYNTSVSYGTVTVGNDLVNLYVTYELAAGNTLEKTYLYVGLEEGLPVGGPYGNHLYPDGEGHYYPTMFPHKTIFSQNETSFSYVIPLEGLPECFIVLAVADIKNAAGTVLPFVSAKARPELKCYGYYMQYCKQDCISVCETGYAFGNSYANCFLTIPGVNSNNWGWSNGSIGNGTYSWPIYAGAGLCDITVGTLVGTLDVMYSGGTATITYNMEDGVQLMATHLFVGKDILPKKNNKYTTAPGQFPYKHDNLNGVNSDSYTINGLSGNIYISAHADVCW